MSFKNVVGRVKIGDPIRAGHYNKLVDAAETVGKNERKQVQDAPGFVYMVRIIWPVISRASTLYTALEAANTDEAKYNAVVQVYDPEEKKWVDDPAARKIEVDLGDDEDGWRPLEKERRLPVVWNRAASRWIPLETNEASVIAITDNQEDQQGFKKGVRYVWNSDTRAWKEVEAIYILDFG